MRVQRSQLRGVYRVSIAGKLASGSEHKGAKDPNIGCACV